MGTAYSYVRISSKRQLKGDGVRRQLEKSQDYAAKHGLDLDESLQDLGVSAFTGANREHGALAQFLMMIKGNKIEVGSYLLVESLDRLSRDHIDIALPVFLSITRAGVNVVTLSDEQVYTRENIRSNPLKLFGSLLIMSRAREEIELRVQRQRATWEKKRLNAGTQKLSGKCPSWLKLNETKTDYDVFPDRAATVRRMFEDHAAGIGRGGIARRLNEDGIPAFAHGRHWHMGTVSKILGNDAVIGVYHPMTIEHYELDGIRMTRRIPAMEPKLDYYPRIISDELWQRAQESSRRRALKPSHNPAGRIGSKANTLFSRFARCAICGNPMTYRDQGPRGTPVLRCSAQMMRKCENAVRVRYRSFEDAILDFVDEVDFSMELPDEVAAAREALASKTLRREAIKKRRRRLIEAFDEDDPEALGVLADLREEDKQIEIEIGELERAIRYAENRRRPQDRQAVLADLRRQQETGDRYRIRSQMAETLREVLDVILVDDKGIVHAELLNGLIQYRFSPDMKHRTKIDLHREYTMHPDQDDERAATRQKALLRRLQITG